MKLIQQVGALFVFLFSTFSVLAYSEEVAVEFERGTAVINLKALRVVPMPDGDTAYGADAVLLWKDGRRVPVTIYIAARAGCGEKPHIMYLAEVGTEDIEAVIVAHPGTPDEQVAEAICGAIGKAKELPNKRKTV